MIRLQDHPKFLAWAKYSSPFEKLDLESQLHLVVRSLGREKIERSHQAAKTTAAQRASVGALIIHQLVEGGFKLPTLLRLRQEHVRHLADRWNQEQLAADTILARFSVLRWLAAAIGKPGMVQDLSCYGLAWVSHAKRLKSGDRTSWSAKQVKTDQIIAKVETIDGMVACQLRLMHAFGLKLRHVLLMRPTEFHQGDELHLAHGTRGGRALAIPMRTETQHCALQHAKYAAGSTPSGRLVSEGTSFESARSRFYCVMKRYGITKAQLGVTSHGLRHDCAKLHSQASGRPNPAQRQKTTQEVKDRSARILIADDLGLAWVGSIAAYLGPAKLER
jgi:hypothetical protein